MATPEVRQSEAVECGLAALAIVLGSYGLNVTLEELRDAVGLNRKGTTARTLVALARGYGFSARGFRREPDDLRGLMPPFIIHYRFNHFVVVEGFFGRGVCLNDPAVGPWIVPIEEFREDFTGLVLIIRPGSTNQRRGEPFRWWWHLTSHVLQHRGLVVATVLASLVASLAVAAASLLIARIASPAGGGAVREGTLIAGATLVALAAGHWRECASGHLSGALARDAVAFALDRMRRLPGAFFMRRSPEQIVQKATATLELARQGPLLAASCEIPSALILAGAAGIVDPVVGGVSAALLALDGAAVAIAYGRRAGLIARLGEGKPETMASSAAIAATIETFKVGGRDAELFATLAGQHAALAEQRQRAGASHAGMQAVRQFLASAGLAVSLGLGGVAVATGRLAPAEVGALCLLAVAMRAPLDRLEAALRGRSPLKTASQQLADLEQARVRDADNAAGATAPSRLRGASVEVVELSWGSAPLLPPQPPLIDRLSLSLEPGLQLGVTGVSGSGKSVLACLLCGLLDPQRGRVLVDGMPAALAGTSRMALVGRWTPIFPGTVADNLRLGAELPKALLVAALQEVDLWDELLQRGGLDLLLVHDGDELSGGQRRRLALARTLLRNPRLLVLDAALDSIEPEREAVVLAMLRRRGTTVVLISGRTSGLHLCDQVLTLRLREPAALSAPVAAR